jgi:D-alanine transaminase
VPQPLAYYQGRIQPLGEVMIPALDRGFLFGDAVYEVLRVYQGKPWLEEEHWQRLERSLAEIRIAGVDLQRLRKRMHETIAAGPFGEAMVYLQITRGAAARRRHAFNAPLTPTELLWVEDYDDGPTAAKRETGVAVISQPDLRWQRCDIKSTNLLANVMANTLAAERGASEAILYLPDGTLSEATHSSFFWVKDGVLFTTPIGDNILPSITRQFLIEVAAKEKIPFREAKLRGADVFGVDEFFLAGTTSEVLPVATFDGRPIAGGKPGPLSRRLLAVHQQAVATRLSACR